MASKKNDSSIAQGSRIEVPATGKIFQWLADGTIRLVIKAANSFLNLSVIVPFDPGNGAQYQLKYATVKTSDGNTVITLPPLSVSAASGGTGNSRVFQGAGAPSASTLTASSYLASPNPDLYIDTSNQNLYYCSTAGTNSTSVWTLATQPLATVFGFYDNTLSWKAGSIIQVNSSITVGGVTLTPGTYGCLANVPANATGNQVPQFPYPFGTVYWMLIALGVNQVSICQGGNKSVYINSSQSF